MNASATPALVLDVEHVTRYHYATPVELAHHLAYLRPHDSAWQAVQTFELEVRPEPMHRSEGLDHLGNHRTAFMLNQPHRELEVSSRSRVRVSAPPALDLTATLPWEAVRERLRYAAGRPFEPANEFVHASPYVPTLPALAQWAAPAFTAGRPVAQVGLALMARLHAEFTYRSASTAVDTPLALALERREGVCQDFAHILIGALRSHGLAARYVSGYLLTVPPTSAQTATQDGAAPAPWLGADASHAWVALWCPRAEPSAESAGEPTADPAGDWLELDPTNNVMPALGHVRLAYGRDYGDVTPLRGVIRGGGEHRFDVHVRTTLA